LTNGHIWHILPIDIWVNPNTFINSSAHQELITQEPYGEWRNVGNV